MRKTFLFCCLLLSGIIIGQNTYLHCGKLIDTKEGKVLTNKTIIISGKKIMAIENGFSTPKSASDVVIDLKSQTVMPGLIDMHVHIESETNPSSYLQRYTLNEADVAFNAQHFADVTLKSGFTTVRDLGGSGVNVALRNAINAGKVDGPRIFTAEKSLVDDARKAVRQRYKNGADWIKITATGGVLSVAKSGMNPQFTVEEIKAICETAKDYGLFVAAHAHGDEGMQRAILGGVKTIEHGTFMSDETMELMKKHNVYLVPTIIAGKSVSEKALIPNYYPEVIAGKALDIGPRMQSMFERAYKKGVGIGFGTDAAVFAHGENGKEFGYMVEAGMPAIKAIQSATLTNAMLLQMDTQIGQLKEGFLADIVATNQDPTEDIGTMTNVVFVMKEGKIYKQ